MSTIKPLIKWSGSKRSKADQLASFIPSFRRYYEPFVGGGSLLYLVSPEDAVVGDSCKPLIDLWEAVKTFPERLASEYRYMWEALQEDNDFYYRVRDRFNEYQEPWDFLFLTRTCMNGLIRFNMTRAGIPRALARGRNASNQIISQKHLTFPKTRV